MLVLLAVALVGLTAATSQVPMPGGFTEQNASDPEYMDMAWKTATAAVNSDARNANTNMAFVPMKVISVKTQVVAGQNTDMVVEFGESNCRKVANEITASACQVNANGPTKVYKIRIFTQPWTNTIEVTSVQQIQKP